MNKTIKLETLFAFNFTRLYFENLTAIRDELDKRLGELWPQAKELEVIIEAQFERLLIENTKITNCDFSSDADFICIWPNKTSVESKCREVTIVFDSESDLSEEITIWFQDDKGYTESGDGFTKKIKKTEIATDEFLKSVILWLEKLEKS